MERSAVVLLKATAGGVSLALLPGEFEEGKALQFSPRRFEMSVKV